MHAHFLNLPDGRFQALADAAALIRARYIGSLEHAEERIGLLNERPSRDLEVITARLYEHMGYRAKLTPPYRDGGRDVIANRDDAGHRERIRIECKRHTTKRIDVRDARAILGVVSNEKAPKGMIVTTSKFTRGARTLGSYSAGPDAWW